MKHFYHKYQRFIWFFENMEIEFYSIETGNIE